ncbi:MAG: MFS transporter, partial [Firmicutes bacterium]|nr:MFS transporter [Bacillota bacterium]
ANILIQSFCFSGFIPVLAAMISDVTVETNRNESFSLLYLCINIGYSMGQVIAGQLFYNYTRWIFWGQGLAFLISGAVILFFLKDMPAASDVKHAQAIQKTREPHPVYHASSTRNGSFLKAFLKDHVLIIFLLAIVLVQYSHAQISYLMPLQLSSLFGLEASAKWNSYMWFTNGVCCIVLTPILLNLTKRFSQVVNVAIAAITYVIGMGGFYFLSSEQNLWIILVFTVVWTAGEVLVSTGTGVFIADRAAPQYRASYQSLYSLSSDFGRCLGPLTMGYILLVCNYAQGWIVTAAVSLAAVVILLFCYRMYRKEQVTK